MAELELTNIIDISVSEAGAGAGEYNTSNIGLFSREEHTGDYDLGYKLYLSPTEVGTDWGTDSDTFAMANSMFSQAPNILAGNGYLAIIPFVDTAAVTEVQKITFPTIPASGAWKLKYGLLTTGSLAFDATAADVQTALRLLSGLGTVTVTGDYTLGMTVTFVGVTGDATLLVITEDSLQDSTPENVSPVVSVLVPGTTASTETLAAAVTRTQDLIQYFGVMAAELTSESDMLAAAAVVQALNKIAFFVGMDEADVADGGLLDLLTTGGFTKSRGLYYGGFGDTDPEKLTSALGMMAAYGSRGLSTNFSGSNTTQTMHLKDLRTVQPDPTMTQTLLGLCQDAGADVYASFQGVAKTYTSGENKFFDQVYNLQWFIGALQIAGFNYLAQSSTKVPQTENGISGLKGAYSNVCGQAANCQYAAPGTWNSSTTFGNQENFLANILQFGFYVYSQPIALQSQTARAARQAPLVQIALKEAGAVQSSNVIVNVNA